MRGVTFHCSQEAFALAESFTPPKKLKKVLAHNIINKGQSDKITRSVHSKLDFIKVKSSRGKQIKMMKM